MNASENEVIQLTPLPFHHEIFEYIFNNERALWDWFSNPDRQKSKFESAKLELLKTTYRIDVDSASQIYKISEKVKKQINCEAPVTFYQAQQSPQMNASLIYMPGEIHIVLHGDILNKLNNDELEALVCHEIAHFSLNELENGKYKIIGDLLIALSNDNNASSINLQSLKFFCLYTELFCDCFALQITKNFDSTVSTLVKIETGLTEVSPKSYLEQAEEILAKGIPQTEGFSHPECYIRTVALDLWQKEGEEAYTKIRPMIEGELSLKEMDLLSQTKIMDLTRRMLDTILAPKWMKTPATMAHARLFFEDYVPLETTDLLMKNDLVTKDKMLKQYYCYLMLDFAVTDQDLEDVSLASMLLLAKDLDLYKEFTDAVVKELKPGKKVFENLQKNAETIVASAEKSLAKVSDEVV